VHRSVAIVLILLLFSACSEPTRPVPPLPTDVTLALVEVTCTHTFLRLALPPMASTDTTDTAVLLRDGKEVRTLRAVSADTVLFVDSLRPGTTYTFTARLLHGGRVRAVSPPLAVRTLDTTDHDFILEFFTLGEKYSNVLSDVCIVNDTLAYAVGEMYGNRIDSLTGMNEKFNLAVWNGRTWTLKKLTYQGGAAALRSVFARSADDVWFDPWFRTDGDTVRFIPMDQRQELIGASVTKMWGYRNFLYVVGKRGFIGLYDGTKWRKLESGTTADINDIWGSVDARSGEAFVLCAVTNVDTPGDRLILRVFADGHVERMPYQDGRRVHSVWFPDSTSLFVCGSGVHLRTALTPWLEQPVLQSYYSRRIRGVAANDVFAVAAYGTIAHYSGASWGIWPNTGASIWYSCAYRNNVFMAVGSTPSQKACIAVMKR
jgi:hypothetical protein